MDRLHTTVKGIIAGKLVRIFKGEVIIEWIDCIRVQKLIKGTIEEELVRIIKGVAFNEWIA
jgi:hypothetical protein